MMTMNVFVKAIRANAADYPTVCAIPLTLYDSKDRVESNEQIEYADNLFAENPLNEARIIQLLNELEKNPVESISIKIDISHVVVFYKTPNAMAFSRNQSLDPMDYMD